MGERGGDSGGVEGKRVRMVVEWSRVSREGNIGWRKLSDVRVRKV